MNNELNFDNFVNSDFYKKASYHYFYDKTTEEIRNVRGSYSIISTTMLNEDLLLDIPESQTFKNIYPELYYLLYSSKLDILFRKLIVDQWVEVIKHTKMQEVFPSMSYLLLIPANTTIQPHKHIGFSKQTVSFIYNYNFSESNNNYIMVNDIEFKIPPKEKILLNMYDNPCHSAYIDNGFWFIWVNEYKKHFRVKDETLKAFYLLE
jgi:hypothetical protein